MAVSGADRPSEGPVLRIIRERPWILLILAKVLDLGGGTFTATEIAESLGVRSYIVQRALWWLKKYGFVEEIAGTVPKKYRLKSVEDPRVSDIRQFRWVCGNTVVLMVSDLYIVLINRGDDIVARVIPKQLVENVQKVLQSIGDRRDVNELSKALNLVPSIVATALRVLDTLFCKRARQ